MKKLLALIFLAISPLILAQSSPSTFDAATGIIRIPHIVLGDTHYEFVDLKVNSSGTLDVVEAGPVDNSPTIPPDASFVFVDSGTVMVPVVDAGTGTYFYNLVLSLVPGDKLAITSYEAESAELNFREGDIMTIDSAIVVSSDLNSVTYPDSFQNVAARPVELIAPQCDLTPSTFTYPADWNGDLGLPPIQDAPFGPGPELTIGLKDFWQVGNPSFNTGCAGDAEENFRLLVKRLIALNVSQIELTPWTFIDDRTSTWKILGPEELIAETGTSIPNDEELAWITQVAQENGLKVHWRNQIQGNLGSQIPAETLENMEKFLPAYEEYMLERADFLNSIGVDAMQFDCICWFAWYNDNEVTQPYHSLLDTLVVEIDQRFDGELFNEHQHLYLARNNILSTTDEVFINLSLWLDLDAEEQAALEPSMIKEKTIQAVNGVFSQYPQEVLDDITVSFEVGSPSRFNFFESRESIEETFCTSGFNTISQEGDECIQRTQITDFSAQARVVQGVLEGLKAQTLVPNFRVAAVGYWLTQPVLDGSTFPNIAYSVRGKPAEKILQIWFDR